MGTRNQLWSIAKTSAIGSAIGLTISDRYVTIVSTRGDSMHPTLTASDSAFRGDVLLAERGCLDKYKFSRGDVVIFKCPSDHKEDFVKRLIALPGEWIQIPTSREIIKIPAGHCWVEGDNAARSWDSRSFGPIPLGLIKGRVTHIIWPPSKMGRVERKCPEGGSHWFLDSNSNLRALHLQQLYFLSDNDTLVKGAARIIQRNQFEASKAYVPRSLNFKANHHAKLALKL